MQWLYDTYGDAVYQTDFLTGKADEIIKALEDQQIELNAKQRKKLFNHQAWLKQRGLLQTAEVLMNKIGTEQSDDFNAFSEQVNQVIKAENIKLSATEKKAILNVVSWYNEAAAKVIKKLEKLSADKLESLLARLGSSEADLPDYGYYPTAKKGEFITYESSSDLRDSETIPLNQSIHDYFLAEVKPHVDEAWIHLDSVKIGYEISFNKYFYQHKPLRSLEEVAQEMIELEQQAEGLIAEILGVSVQKVQGV